MRLLQTSSLIKLLNLDQNSSSSLFPQNRKGKLFSCFLPVITFSSCIGNYVLVQCRLDKKKCAYDLVWEDDHLLSGKVQVLLLCTLAFRYAFFFLVGISNPSEVYLDGISHFTCLGLLMRMTNKWISGT